MATKAASKRKKLSYDFVEENSEQDGDSKAVDEKPVIQGEEGATLIDISARKKVSIRKWKSSTLVDIREYWADGEILKPGKKGISLSVDQWKALIKIVPDIDKAIANLEK